MKISYKWLRQYVDFDLQPNELADALTSIGLETASVDEVESIKGGLKGLVVGKVLTCIDHPNSDHLHITTVDVGGVEPLPIVCGAPNVAAGQHVIVATIGTTLYSGDDSFVIKKGKIRGEQSHGMICSAVEIGVGSDSDGIMVLPDEMVVGTPAADYFNVESDYLIEIDITPNRVDATSHYGVARDLAAYLSRHGKPTKAIMPSIQLPQATAGAGIKVHVESAEACPRYQGLLIEGVKVQESPKWLCNYLQTIGLRSVNNLVDIGNFVLFEMGQPLHMFDAKALEGGIEVKTLAEETPFVTLDGVERKLTDKDLMICNAKSEPLCIAGVFGGLNSGVTEATTDIFIESANFNPSMVRKTARRFALNTDSSFRFERGLDPEMTQFALHRAASLVLELAGGTLVGEEVDLYPVPVKPYQIELNLTKVDKLLGHSIERNLLRAILNSLEIEIVAEEADTLSLLVPRYRTDVTRDVDVIEELLRIYGYNTVEPDGYLKASLSVKSEEDIKTDWQVKISQQLSGAGFNEILNNSFTPHAYYKDLQSYPAERAVLLANPLSQELNCMRQTLLFGGLQSIGRNLRRKQNSIYFYEFGNCYSYDATKENAEKPLTAYNESTRLGLWLCGQKISNSWAHPNEATSVYELKAHVEQILRRLGIRLEGTVMLPFDSDIYSQAMELKTRAGRQLGSFGIVSAKLLQLLDVEQAVYYAELSWEALMLEAKRAKIEVQDLPKYPEVKRDLALLLDKNVQFSQIESIAKEVDKKVLRRIELFDVYEGKNLPAGKKSYAVSFYLRNDEKTLTDKQIDSLMQKLQQRLCKELAAELR